MMQLKLPNILYLFPQCLTDTSSEDDIIILPQTESEAIVPHDNPPALPRRSNRVSRPPDRYMPHW